MGLFGKKKEAQVQSVSLNVKNVKVLGAGCKACHHQLEQVEAAVKNVGLSLAVDYITDMAEIVNYGVMSMPAIVINGKVASCGKVIKAAEVEKLLKKYGG